MEHAGNVLAIQTEISIHQRLHQLMFWFFNSSWLSKYLTKKKVELILLGNNTVSSQFLERLSNPAFLLTFLFLVKYHPQFCIVVMFNLTWGLLLFYFLFVFAWSKQDPSWKLYTTSSGILWLNLSGNLNRGPPVLEILCVCLLLF
jgi:hypothetical protein